MDASKHMTMHIPTQMQTMNARAGRGRHTKAHVHAVTCRAVKPLNGAVLFGINKDDAEPKPLMLGYPMPSEWPKAALSGVNETMCAIVKRI